MLIIDVALLAFFLITLLLWIRGVWPLNKGDLLASGVMFAASLAAYVFLYRATALSHVSWLFSLTCAAAAGIVAAVKHRRGSSPRAAGVCLAVMLCAVLVFFFAERRWVQGSNSLLVIAPYRSVGTWVFDEPRLGLRAEPFVAGVPELLDKLIAEAGIPDADEGFRLTFSAQPFPGFQTKITWLRGEFAGNWYYSKEYDLEGWLCPALFKFFKRAPNEIYVKAEAVRPANSPTQTDAAVGVGRGDEGE
jgi:hypothetical protein